MQLTLRVEDPEQRHAAVRLRSDLPGQRDFARENGSWVLHLDGARLARLEYQLELIGHDGESEVVCDPDNPHQAPGAFGPKSVLLAPGYEAPAWLDAPKADGDHEEVANGVVLWSPAGSDDRPLPLLLAHDGPEYDELSSLTAYSAAMIAAGTLPAHRVALLPPGDRNERYSASAVYARLLLRRILPSLPAAGPPVAMGASLGALAVLHAHRRSGGRAFSGLFLQSGSFFIPRFDRHESGFPRYERIVRFVRGALRAEPTEDPIPITLTCGAEEENVHNNRVMANALAVQGHDVEFVEVPDLHNYTGWRDAFDPHLTDLLMRLW